MTRRVQSILLDTNVWLDFYFGDRPRNPSARRLFRLADERGITLLYAITSSKDVYYLSTVELKAIARKERGPVLSEEDAAGVEATAAGIVASMMAQGMAVGLDMADVWVATKQRHLHRDYEDNLIVAAAMRAKVDVLVTNDKKLLRHSMVLAMTPDDLCTLLENDAAFVP